MKGLQKRKLGKNGYKEANKECKGTTKTKDPMLFCQI
jgi:hypothetical protein